MQTLLLAKNPMFGSYDKGIYIFTLDVRYYAIVIVLGMIIAAALSALLMKRRNMSPDFIYLLFICCIPSAIVGARLFSCLTDPSMGIKYLFVFPWEGLSITGGVIGGVLAGFIVCLVAKVDFLRAADCVVITILLAQAIGRWGNYFNEEVYGQVVRNPSLQFFPLAVKIGSEWHYAFFFIEGFVNVIGFALLYTLTWFRKSKPNGISMFLYFVWYGTVRAIMEPFRDEGFVLDKGGIMWSELFAFLMIGFGICGILLLLIFNYKKEGSFIGSRLGDPCGITEYIGGGKGEQPYFSKINMLGANYPVKPQKGEKQADEAPEEKTENDDTGEEK